MAKPLNLAKMNKAKQQMLREDLRRAKAGVLDPNTKAIGEDPNDDSSICKCGTDYFLHVGMHEDEYYRSYKVCECDNSNGGALTFFGMSWG